MGRTCRNSDLDWQPQTYWYHCSTLLQQPSHGRRPRLRSAESLRTVDVSCCAVVSLRGKKPRSFWFSGESYYRVIHRPGHPLCPRRGSTPPRARPPATRLLPLDAHYRRLGYPQYAQHLVAVIYKLEQVSCRPAALTSTSARSASSTHVAARTTE